KLPPFIGQENVTIDGGFIMNLTIKEKLKLAKEHVDNGVPLHEIRAKYKYDLSNFKYYCALYKRYGDKAFENHGQRKKYTREMKLKAIDRVLRNGETYRQVSLDLMLTDPKIVHDWVTKYKNEGEASIKDTHSRSHYVTNKQREIIEANKKTKERLEYLEAENEYLKKLYSLIQKKKQLKK
ncbi:MAG: transposase, partial [Anaeroplasma sp.]